MNPRVLAAACLSAGLLLTSCANDIDPEWTAATLPLPDGAPGRIGVRDAVHCGEAWYAVGGVLLTRPTETRDSRPAAWRSADGITWEALAVIATTYWGRRAVLLSVACSDGAVVAVGARAGGAHAYPRVTTFFEKDGGLDDQLAPFNLYGGATATNVGPISGAAPGWLITGNRITGPAVWHSTNGRDFTIEEDVPGLADEEGFTSLTQDGVWDGDQWVVVGGGNAIGTIDREPLEWISPDGRTWERRGVEGTTEFDDLERVVATDDAHASPFVSSLATGDRGLWATTSDGASYALWHSGDGRAWSVVPLPATAPETAAERILTVATHDKHVLLLADDGTAGRVWTSVR